VANKSTEVMDVLRADFDVALNEVHGLHLLRYVWKNILAMLDSSPEIEPEWLVNYYLATIYTHTLAVGIRRECEADGPRPTIGDVLRRVRHNSGHFAAASCGFTGRDEGPGLWLRYAKTARGKLDPSRVDEQIAALTAVRADVKRYVDKRVAHRESDARELISFTDLEAALDGLRTATQFLFGLFNAGSWLGMFTPDPPVGWYRPFEQAWLDRARAAS
jgi:hypothetical protein